MQHARWQRAVVLRSEVPSRRKSDLGTDLSAAIPDYLTVKQPNIVKVLPNVEGPITEAHFVYPQSLKNVARVQAFRNFLYSKISEWEF